MIESNMVTAGISTDYEIAAILSNFSDDLIANTISESILYRFRPFGLRTPNYVALLCGNINNVLMHQVGHDDEVNEKKEDMLHTIIDTICEKFGMVITTEIPPENLYTFAYILYQLFVSEFTSRMLNFYTQYVINNMQQIITYIKQSDEVYKTVYAKKIYNNNQDYGIIYDNMIAIMDIVAGLDISLYELILYLSDKQTADFMCNFIDATDDVYKKHFASFIKDPSTTAEVVTNVRLKFVSATFENKPLINPDTNPYINREEPICNIEEDEEGDDTDE